MKFSTLFLFSTLLKSIAVFGVSSAYVANQDDGNLSVIDTGTNTVSTTATVGTTPFD